MNVFGCQVMSTGTPKHLISNTPSFEVDADRFHLSFHSLRCHLLAFYLQKPSKSPVPTDAISVTADNLNNVRLNREKKTPTIEDNNGKNNDFKNLWSARATSEEIHFRHRNSLGHLVFPLFMSVHKYKIKRAMRLGPANDDAN